MDKLNLRDDLIPVANITVFRCTGCGHAFALPSNMKIRVRDIRCTNCAAASALRLDLAPRSLNPAPRRQSCPNNLG